jgi:hypothetical protein
MTFLTELKEVLHQNAALRGVFLLTHAKEIIALVEAAAKGMEAMNVWVNTYAPELCDQDEVAKARKIISDGGGTLAYIADVNEQLHEVLAALDKEKK